MDQMFGRYRLIEVIGQGGMGTVFRARDTLIDRDVAIKVLAAELSAEPGYQERFRREAYTAARLTEPHIIPVYEAGDIEDRLYLTMPVIAGIDLEALLERQGPMSPPQAVKVIEQIATALDAAHTAGLVHRDVKPSNALMTSNEFVYLIDFGIAHDAAATKLTQTGSIVGTLAYMSPERFSAGTADARADVYALACVLYECLTGQRPYPGGSIEQQIAAHLTLDPPKPSAVNSAIPVGFDTVIAHGMAKNPDERYQTAQQLAAAARALIEAAVPPPWHSQQPLVPTYPDRPATPGRSRKPWIIAGAATTAVVVTGATVAAAIGLGSHPTPPTFDTTTTTRPASITAHTTSTAPSPMVTPDRLDAILLTAQDINAVMGATNMRSDGNIAHGGLEAVTLSDPDCLGALLPGEAPAYQGSGYVQISALYMTEPSTTVEHEVTQAAASFPTYDQAVAFVKNSAVKWRACAGRAITESINGSAIHWTFGNVVGDVPTITQANTRPESGTWSCQRVLHAVWNLVIDVFACGFQVTDQGRQIADKMAGKATQ